MPTSAVRWSGCCRWVDGVLLLVDAVEGPMPQTRFVTRKALALGLKAIVVVNKIDRPSARPGWVVDQTFELFDKLGANDAQLDFPVIYASAIQGWASTDYTERRPDMNALFEAILAYVPPPQTEIASPLQLQISLSPITPMSAASASAASGWARCGRDRS